MGAVVLLGTVGLALSGGLQAIAIAYAFALLVVICGLAVAVPVIVVWSFIEEGMRS
jgi:biopolymer transport protein ExbB/TolQ